MTSPYPFLHGSTSSLVPGQSTTSLPAYTRLPTPPPRPRTPRLKTEHVVELSNNSGIGGAASKKSKPWAVLKVYSNARSSKSLPTFVEGDSISGSVTLDLGSSSSWISGSNGSGDAITSVKIIIRGEVASGNINSWGGNKTFLETSTLLWTKDTHNAKLSGEQHWPFSISLPRQVCLSNGDKSEDERPYVLPHTFLERNIRVSIHYDLVVHVMRKLRPDSNLQQTFVYIPAIRPDPPSLLRQLAYQENSPLAGPSIDPEGWFTLPSVKLHGTVFSSRTVEISCTLSLAKPLSYTRGSVLPLSLLLESADSQALDLLTANPTSTIHARLRRHLDMMRSDSVRSPVWNLPTQKSENVHDLGEAVWWLAAEQEQDANGERKGARLEGEIPLAKELKPSILIPHFCLEYFVVLLPFTATGFAPLPSPSPSPSPTPSPSHHTPPSSYSNHPRSKSKSRPSTSPAPSSTPMRSASYTPLSSSPSSKQTLSVPTRSASFTPRPSTSPSSTNIHFSSSSSSSSSSHPSSSSHLTAATAAAMASGSGSSSSSSNSGSGGRPLLVQPVKIATVFAKGPRPISGRPDLHSNQSSSQVQQASSRSRSRSRGPERHGGRTTMTGVVMHHEPMPVDDSLPPGYEDHV
ncbi:hypothetical protein K435DRAFT_876945 [Dendrothele bispora CBS 962.96]|uniref:Arrestin-like N-terminal domain-containing protein n=1 Tax=Dendrothele bispora (strain CBS 962.96) TaxID=1314807 RepID=A0A4S8KR90_DENBC|nr:hypothetical protein K435DRAFT_876945 [Dendrothele bispora CBS 962.96]